MNQLFVYGTLKPDEIAYPQIEPLIDNYQKAEITSAQIYLRDGLPVLKLLESDGYKNEKVNGYILNSKIGCEEELIRVVKDYEGTNYKLDSVTVRILNNEFKAAVFVGAKINQSHPEIWEGDWNSAHSPLLGYGLPFLLSKLNFKEPHPPLSLNPGSYWKENEYWLGTARWPGLLRIEGDFLTLSSIFEYVLSLRFGRTFGSDVMKKISRITSDPVMNEAFKKINVNPDWDVRDVTNIGAGKSTPINLRKTLESCYQVRSNLTHRGKSVKNDAEKVLKATQILADLLKAYLLLQIPELKNVWPDELVD